MDDKKAAEVLIKMLSKYCLKGEEKEAVESAIGVFAWTSLAGGAAKKKREKKGKSKKW